MQRFGRFVWGYLNGMSTSATSNQDLTAADTWVAYSFVAAYGEQLTTVRSYFSAITGNPTDIRAALYSDNAGTPDAALTESGAVDCSGGAGAYTFTFGTPQTLTPGTLYWIVLKNYTATPASNYVKVLWPAFNILPSNLSNANPAAAAYSGWMKMTQIAGAAWGTRACQITNIRLGYANGKYDGIVCLGASSSSNHIYSTREKGLRFLTPPNAYLRVRAAGLVIGKTGTPTGILRYRLYTENGGLLSTTETTYSLSTALVGAGATNYIVLPFERSVVLAPNTRYLLVAGETTNADSSSNRFTVNYPIQKDSDTGSAELYGCENVEAYFDGSSWSFDTTRMNSFGLYGEALREFEVPPINRRQFFNMR